MMPTKTIIGIAVTVVATGVDLFITHRMKKRAYNEGYAEGHNDGMEYMKNVIEEYKNEKFKAAMTEDEEVESL